MAHSSLRHIVFVCGPVMTHIRPSLHFCAHLASKFPGVFISIYTPGPLAAQSDDYLSTYHKAVHPRLRIVPSVVDVPLVGPIDIVLSMERSFGPWISNLVAASSLDCNGYAVEPPSYIIEDHISGGIALAHKDKHRLPIASWWVANAISFISHFSGAGGRLANALLKSMRSQKVGSKKSPDEMLAEETTDRLVCMPGIPPHYEREQVTQLVGDMILTLCELRERWNKMLEQTDMVVLTGEPVAVEACIDAFDRPIKPFDVGLAADLPASVNPTLDPHTSDPVLSFMNRAHGDLGPESVVYIAFGSLWFPPPESALYLKTLIQEIIARGLRFVFSVKPEYASIAGMDEEYMDKLTKSGQGMFPSWVKQLEVLEHPALHYFVSHGGWNSSTEAIVRGVPMIFWPIYADQPVNALHITKQHDCGFELLQVRTGLAKTTAYGPNGDSAIVGSEEAAREEIRNVLEMTQGVRGKQQRQNVRTLGKVARESIAPGGSGDVALERFGKGIGL
ncbi:glycosyltransferase family 1 protein [Ceratobasidium sp. AG-Ba]|nr:glycosyltransferase family 1 protein [Ceratobasidium sp. AG-Ba]